jgi:hypothetical protein
VKLLREVLPNLPLEKLETASKGLITPIKPAFKETSLELPSKNISPLLEVKHSSCFKPSTTSLPNDPIQKLEEAFRSIPASCEPLKNTTLSVLSNDCIYTDTS